MGRAHDQSAKRVRLLVTKLEREGTAINCTWIIITEIQNTIGGGVEAPRSGHMPTGG